jgi:hypothetical protein
LNKKPIKRFWREEIQLILRIDPLLFEPLIQSLKVVPRVFELFLIFRRRIADLVIVFDLYNIDRVAFLYEEIWTEFASLCMLALLPRIFERVESLV